MVVAPGQLHSPWGQKCTAPNRVHFVIMQSINTKNGGKLLGEWLKTRINLQLYTFNGYCWKHLKSHCTVGSNNLRTRFASSETIFLLKRYRTGSLPYKRPCSRVALKTMFVFDTFLVGYQWGFGKFAHSIPVYDTKLIKFLILKFIKKFIVPVLVFLLSHVYFLSGWCISKAYDWRLPCFRPSLIYNTLNPNYYRPINQL